MLNLLMISSLLLMILILFEGCATKPVPPVVEVCIYSSNKLFCSKNKQQYQREIKDSDIVQDVDSYKELRVYIEELKKSLDLSRF